MTRGRRGGMGGGVGRWPMEGGQGGRWGGHQRAVWEQQKVHWFPFLGSLKNLTTGLIWLVTRVGGWGGAVGRWPMEGGERGEMGGAFHLCSTCLFLCLSFLSFLFPWRHRILLCLARTSLCPSSGLANPMLAKHLTALQSCDCGLSFS